MTQQSDLYKDDLVQFFVHHPDRIYTANTQLLERLPEILFQVQFADLEAAIHETIEIVQAQRERMKIIYDILEAKPCDGSINGLKGLIDESFEDIKQQQDNAELRDMSILFYMTNIEALEMASFQVLQLLAVKIGHDEIKSLIKKNYEDAKMDKALLLLITTKYLATV